MSFFFWPPQTTSLGTAAGLDAPAFLSDVELTESPEFQRCYRGRRESVP